MLGRMGGMNNYYKALLLVLLFIGLNAGISLAASTPLSGVNPNTALGFFEGPSNSTWGWSFTVLTPIQITDVAWFDVNGDGLSHSHRIGLWMTPATQPIIYTNLFGSGIVIPSGTTAELDGVWRKVAIPSPMTLQPGDYTLGGENFTNSTDQIRYVLGAQNDAGLLLDPRIASASPGFSGTTGFNRPDFFIAVFSGLELGPMLFAVPAPEPTSLTLMVSLFIVVSMSRCYRK